MKRKILLTLNRVLFLFVIVLVFLNFYREKIYFNCEYGAVPQDVLEKINQRLRKGNLQLCDLSSGNQVHFSKLSDISKIYIVHANCSSCQLKSHFSDLKLKNLLDNDKKQIVIFSIYADRYKLKLLLSEHSIGAFLRHS
jgi:hypothetical protein